MDKDETQSYNGNDKENENAASSPSIENRNTSLGRLVKSVLIDCISDTSVAGPSNIIKDNLHIGT